MLESKLEGRKLLLSPPYWGPPVPLTLAVLAGGCLRADRGGVCVWGGAALITRMAVLPGPVGRRTCMWVMGQATVDWALSILHFISHTSLRNGMGGGVVGTVGG